MSTTTRYDGVLRAASALVQAERKSLRASEARRDLPAGSTRARVTTANARWSIAAEARDRAIADLALVAACVGIV